MVDEEYILLKDLVWNMTNPIHNAGVLKSKLFELSIVRKSVIDSKLQLALDYMILELICDFGKLLLDAQVISISFRNTNERLYFLQNY